MNIVRFFRTLHDMTENPYQSPKAASDPKARQQSVDPQWRGFGQRPKRRMISFERPIGVTISCVINFIAIFVFLIVFMCVDSARFMVYLGRWELCPGIYLVDLFAICVLGMATVFGMWEGAKWSWWTMTFLHIYCFLDTIGDSVLGSVFSLGTKSLTFVEAMQLRKRRRLLRRVASLLLYGRRACVLSAGSRAKTFDGILDLSRRGHRVCN